MRENLQTVSDVPITADHSSADSLPRILWSRRSGTYCGVTDGGELQRSA